MKVRLAKTAGFCFGVQRALDLVYEAVETEAPVGESHKAAAGEPDILRPRGSDGPEAPLSRPPAMAPQAHPGPRPAAGEPAAAVGNSAPTLPSVYTYGPIIHNECVTKELALRGVVVINDEAELRELLSKGALDGSTVIVRAHGIGLSEEEALRDPARHIHLVDATCPLVKKVQREAMTHYEKNEKIIILGTAAHPEIRGILSRIGNDAEVIADIAEAAALSIDNTRTYTILSQTTFNTRKFKDIVEFLKKKIYHVNVVDTVCIATELRQKEAYELSLVSDMMIVIGSRNSSNTAKLYEISKEHCGLTQYIGSLAELDETVMSDVRCVGITAGASTPYSIIQEVLQHVRDEL